MMDIKKELRETYQQILKEMATSQTVEEYAILLVAKANVLIALQKYEDKA